MTKYNIKINKNTIALKNDSTASTANIFDTVLIVFLKFLFIIYSFMLLKKSVTMIKTNNKLKK